MQHHIPQNLMQHNFNKAAATYTEYNYVQRDTARRIYEFLSKEQLHQEKILDLGSGPGTLPHYNKDSVLYDISLNMLKNSTHPIRINGDAKYLPFQNRSFSLVISNLMLQWITQKHLALNEISRVLIPNGVFICCTLIKNSLGELQDAFRSIDAFPHTLEFSSHKNYIDLAHESNFEIISSQVWKKTFLFPNIYSLFKHFKLTGTSFPLGENYSYKGLRGAKFIQTLEKNYKHINNQFPLSYHYLFLVLRKPS